ncbi:MAG: potassium channel family protein [Planctomycetota bacterium]|jgi:voltage-gated potassium channel Kch
MAIKFFDRLFQKSWENRFLFVLVAILSFLILSPLLENFFRVSLFLDLFLTVIFISAIYSVSQKRYYFLIGTLLILPLLLATWTKQLVVSPALALIGTCSGILFFAFMVITIVSFVFKQNRVTLNVINASVVVYLLMAMMWAMLFILLEKVQPGSFSMIASQGEGSTFHFFYYSFVTITTLGYGDITPTTEIARSLALLEAVIGQIYLVVLVARLVGIHIAQSMAERRS